MMGMRRCLQVMDLPRACACMRAEDASAAATALLPRLAWSKHVKMTSNFLLCAEVEALTSAHLRKVNNLLVFPDQSVLIISEREAECVLRALRGALPSTISVCLVSLGTLQWLYPANVLPAALLASSVGERSCLQHADGTRLAAAVAASRLFNGESEYLKTEEETDVEDDLRRKVVRSVISGRRVKPGARELCASERREGVKALVEMRGRRRCWQGSSLELICNELVVEEKHMRDEMLVDAEW